MSQDTASDFMTSPQTVFSHFGEDLQAAREDIAIQTVNLLIDTLEQRPELTVYAPACNTHTYVWADRFLDFVTNNDNSTTMRIALEKVGRCVKNT